MNKEERLTKKIYTEQAGYEWTRLVKSPFKKLELNTTLHFLEKYLPKKGLILDAGGGPGRYTIELAKKGYNVVLLDLVKANLEIAKKQIKKAEVKDNVQEIVEGSILNLSKFKDNSFDAVLCLGGPLSHVSPESNRLKALSELKRVAKKNAPIFVSVMGRFGVLSQAPARWPEEIAMNKHFNELALEGEDYNWRGKNYYCHFFSLEELEKLFDKEKIKIIEKVGLEGFGSANEKAINRLYKKYPKAWENWINAHYKLCTYPTVVDISQHILIVGRKK
ncbi:MAG: class I SAM-dependent methyltransferase [Nanoarchaeota archaeon]|nr:class I SAM-dependent methyltransferase [Nanoarchaeota archaeon]